mmetsp:Transcript_3475/g.5804  ORF Transcript_3475/g.5804 Transcript_3475/m.5804 type:complete len:133 (-) Transcript_3475:1013-1411(-)|eukprot:CAMPEP_0119006120 /NCGR_PEP_ID=MMETSP1176-20130426/2121_1 /TAXON_ID=265551 /ORGANISM="Synedropsis recta cf, Strain CCMP1620" /LENGTH=132 /DNA_ID=CAMNT_0006958007 /DNA_START=167 /DNA_END=565 /DNA_ORIENTATION=+
MRRDEEVVDACIAGGAFLLLCIMYACASNWRCITSCCKKMTDCLCCCCLNWGPARVQSYNDLEELLFDVDETAAGRLVVPGVEEDGDAAAGEITVGNFFCDVLKQKPKRPTVARRQEESMDQSGSRFSEPLL